MQLRDGSDIKNAQLTEDEVRTAFVHWQVSSLQFRVDLRAAKLFGSQGRLASHDWYYRELKVDALESIGWLRLARTALCLSGNEVAKRLGVAPTAYFKFERSEDAGRITLATIRRAAEAMGCEFVYGVRPKEGTFSEAIWRQLCDRAEREMHARRFGRPPTGTSFVKALALTARFVTLEEDTKVRRSLLWNQRLAVRRLPNSFTSGH